MKGPYNLRWKTACIIQKSFHKQQNKVFAYALRVLKFWYSEEYLQKGKYFSSEVWSGEENPSSKEIGWIWQIQTSKTNKQTNRWRIAKYKLQKLHWKSTMVLSVSVTDLFLTKQKLLIWVTNSWPTRQSPLPSPQMLWSFDSESTPVLIFVFQNCGRNLSQWLNHVAKCICSIWC